MLASPAVTGLRSVVTRSAGAVRTAARRAWLPEAASAAEHWQRIVLNDAVRRHITSLDPPTRTAAEISGDFQAQHGWKTFTSLNYPEFDLCAPLEVGERYDVVICEQVLEHVADPVRAAENLRGLCVAGGHVIVSTPFLVRVHELPLYGMADYWRFTPRGLRTLLERAGLVVDQVGSRGNRNCIAGNLDHWPAHRRRHSLRNEPDLPVQVWAFARNAP